jgi:hypothetical protein
VSGEQKKKDAERARRSLATKKSCERDGKAEPFRTVPRQSRNVYDEDIVHPAHRSLLTAHRSPLTKKFRL